MGRFTNKRYRAKGPNPALLDKELVDRLCTKSAFLYGRKWVWRKLCGESQATPEELEKRLDIMVERMKKVYEELNQRAVSRNKGGEQREDSEGSSTVESNDGTEARPRETENGSSTPQGTK